MNTVILTIRTTAEQIADTIAEVSSCGGHHSFVLQLYGFNDWPDGPAIRR